MYDPIELSKKTERLIIDGAKRKYYRFRPTKFYGGIATADAVGCNLRCAFCWSGNVVWKTDTVGNFYSPKQVAETLNQMALKNGFDKVRVSGGEPTIGREHLIELLDNIDLRLLFILETNGILLGADVPYVEELSKFHNIHVRVCLKGSNIEEFSWLTGADSKGFEYQIDALESLRDNGMSFNVAIVSVKGNKQDLFTKLRKIELSNVMI
jgi:uncharacterized Fe-S cluster-containing radical SAM superfamily protein